MIRGVRFMGLLGGELNSATEQAIKEMKFTFNTIAKERVRAELIKILDSPYVFKALESMRKVGILELTLPPLYACMDLENDEKAGESIYEHCLKCATVMETDNPFLRLASLLHDVGKPLTEEQGFDNYERRGAEIVRSLLSELKFSSFEIVYVTELLEKHSFNRDVLATKPQIRKFLSQLKVPVDDFISLRYAETKALSSKQRKMNYLKMRQIIKEITKDSPPLFLKDLNISGQDLKEIGLTPGPLFSEILSACLDKVLEEPSVNENKLLREFAKNYVYTQHRT
jgi:tRNA nucleotidyltransferase (CCA-adding enzyme)